MTTSTMRHRILSFVFLLACMPAFSFIVPPMTTRLLSYSTPFYTPGQQRTRLVHDPRTPVRCESRRRAAPEFQSNEAVSYYHNPESGSKIWLVGVVHDATKSSQVVETVIRKVKPQVVMVEVDPVRVKLLPPGEAAEDSDGLWWWSAAQDSDKIPRFEDGRQAGNGGQEASQNQGEAKGRKSQAVAHKSQRRKGQGKQQGRKNDLGAQRICEFNTAARVAAACGARVLLGDRDYEETNSRLSMAESADKEDARNPSEDHAQKMEAARIKRRDFEGTTPAAWRKMRDLQKSWGFRKFAVLMTERDEVMANNLLKLERNQRTVAVIGAHHTVGIGKILAANGWKSRRK